MLVYTYGDTGTRRKLHHVEAGNAAARSHTCYLSSGYILCGQQGSGEIYVETRLNPAVVVQSSCDSWRSGRVGGRGHETDARPAEATGISE